MNNGPWTLSIQSIVQMHKTVLQTTSKQQKFLAIPQQVSSIFTFKPFSKRCRGKWRSRAALWCKPMMPIIRLSAPASPSVSTWASEINKFGTVETLNITCYVHHGAEMGVTVKGDGLNLSIRPRKGNVHTRPPLLCRVALSYASVAPTSSSKRRLDQLPSRCSIALVAFRVKIPELFTPVSPLIHYLLKHCLPLRTWPGVAPARYPPFTSCCLVVFRILHWNKLAASWTNQNVSLQAEFTNEKNSRSCYIFLVSWCFLVLLGISKAGAMASSKQHQILSKGVPAESSTKRTPSDICIAL